MRISILKNGPRARRAILVALVLVTPLFFLRMTNDQMNLPKLSLLMAGLAIVAALRAIEILQGAGAVGLRRMLIPVGLVAVPLLVAWLASPYRGWALFGEYQRLQGVLPYLVILALGVAVADAFPGRTQQVAWALLAAGAGVGLYAGLQVLGVDPFVWQTPDVAISTLGNPNFTGGFLGIVTPLGPALWLFDPERRTVVLVLLAPLLLGLIVTFSQGGWAAGAAGTLVMMGSLLRNSSRRRLLAWSAAAVVGAAAAGQVVLGIVDPGNPLVPGTVQIRAESWTSAGRMWSEYPVVGRGPNAFAVEGAHFRSERSARQGYNYADDPHSVSLSFLTSAGLLGILGYLGLFGWALFRIRLSTRGDALVAGFAGAVAAYFVQALVSIDEVTIRVAFWVALGALVVAGSPREEAAIPSRKQRRRSHEQRLRSPVAVVAICLVAAAALWWTGAFLVADARAWQGALLAATGSPAEGKAEFEAALGFRDEHEYRRLYGLRVAAGALKLEDAGEELYFDALDTFDHLDRFPQVSRLAEFARVLRAGTVYDPSLPSQALSVYERMRNLDPVNPEIPAEAADLLLDGGRPDDALGWLLPYEDDDVRFAEYWGVLALARAQTGDLEDAKAAARKALTLDADEENALQAVELVQTN